MAHESFHILQLAGSVFHIDGEVRKEVEAFLRGAVQNNAPMSYIIIESLAGEEVTVVADAVNAIFSTSPEIRKHYRDWDKQLNEETGIV